MEANTPALSLLPSVGREMSASHTCSASEMKHDKRATGLQICQLIEAAWGGAGWLVVNCSLGVRGGGEVNGGQNIDISRQLPFISLSHVLI